MPTLNERIAPHTANQMKPSRNTYRHGSLVPEMSVKKVEKVVSAVIASTPPSQIGFESQ